MSSPGSLDLLETLASRLCHDLIGSVTGIGFGVETVGEQGGTADAETLDQLTKSAVPASDRLKFFRLALGSAGRGTPDVGFPEAVTLATSIAGPRPRIEWTGDAKPPRPGPAGIKLLLNVALLANDALPRGGLVQGQVVTGAEGPELRLVATPAAGARNRNQCINEGCAATDSSS